MLASPIEKNYQDPTMTNFSEFTKCESYTIQQKGNSSNGRALDITELGNTTIRSQKKKIMTDVYRHLIFFLIKNEEKMVSQSLCEYVGIISR